MTSRTRWTWKTAWHLDPSFRVLFRKHSPWRFDTRFSRCVALLPSIIAAMSWVGVKRSTWTASNMQSSWEWSLPHRSLQWSSISEKYLVNRSARNLPFPGFGNGTLLLNTITPSYCFCEQLQQLEFWLRAVSVEMQYDWSRIAWRLRFDLSFSSELDKVGGQISKSLSI